ELVGHRPMRDQHSADGAGDARQAPVHQRASGRGLLHVVLTDVVRVRDLHQRLTGAEEEGERSERGSGPQEGSRAAACSGLGLYAKHVQDLLDGGCQKPMRTERLNRRGVPSLWALWPAAIPAVTSVELSGSIPG